MNRKAYADLPAQLSRYEAWLCLLGGLILLAPAWQNISTARTEVRTYDSGKGGGTTQGEGPAVQAMGAALGALALSMVILGGTGLLIRRPGTKAQRPKDRTP